MATIKIAVDTNIFGYAAGIGADPVKRPIAGALLNAIPSDDMIVPTQVIGEFYNILVRKGGYPPMLARKVIIDWTETITVAAYTPDTMREALEVASSRSLQIWDALILAVARANACEILLSEDMQHGFEYFGLHIVNPFKTPTDPRVARLLESP
jgi:predicted nucleic acid-binding protein